MIAGYVKIYYQLFTFVTLLSLYSYFYLDLLLLQFFHAHISSPLMPYIQYLSHLGKSTWYIVGSLLLYLIFRISRPTIAKASLFLLSTTLLSGILVNIIKVIFGRARPKLYIEEHLYGFYWLQTDVLYRSFPSGHATTAIGVWLAFALLFPRYRVPLILMGVVIAMTRIVLTEHYLSDILIGGFLGGLTTMILYRLFYPQGSLHNEI